MKSASHSRKRMKLRRPIGSLNVHSTSSLLIINLLPYSLIITILDGDLGAIHNVKYAFMKQKHRLLWERRHGKVGCGMKSKDNEISAEDNDH